MWLKGALAAVGVEEVLEWLEGTARTGALELENERFHKTVYFVEGTVVGVDSTEPADSLTHHLHRAGLLSRTQIEAADYIQRRTGRALVDVLHRTGALVEEELEASIQEQAREVLLSLFLWETGGFSFREGELPADLAAAVSLEVNHVLEEGRLRRARAHAIRERFPRPTARFARVVEPCEVAIGSALQEEVLRLLKEPRTLLAVMLETRASEYAVLEVMAALLDEGAVRFVDPERSVAPAAGVQRPAGAAAPAEAAASLEAQAEEAQEVTVAVLEPEPMALPRGSAMAGRLLEAARSRMDVRDYDAALALFGRAEQADPSNARLRRLRESAEQVYCQVLYRTELPPEARPVRLTGGEPGPGFGDLARKLYGAMDGALTVRDLVRASGAKEREALEQLRCLRRAQRIELGR